MGPLELESTGEIGDLVRIAAQNARARKASGDNPTLNLANMWINDVWVDENGIVEIRGKRYYAALVADKIEYTLIEGNGNAAY
jgi:hypothetical protein